MRWMTGSLLISLLLCAGCGKVAEFEVSDHLTLIVEDVESKEDTYRAVIRFKERTKYDNIVQEVKITTPRGVVVQLVEAFDTSWSELPEDSKFQTSFEPPTVGDHHWTEKAWMWERRECRFYAAEVEGADRDIQGFAMLPQNMDGSVKTLVSNLINEDYQDRQEIRGEITERHEDTGIYTIEWLPNQLKVSTAVGSVLYDHGQVTVTHSDKAIAAWKMPARNRHRVLTQQRWVEPGELLPEGVAEDAPKPSRYR